MKLRYKKTGKIVDFEIKQKDKMFPFQDNTICFINDRPVSLEVLNECYEDVKEPLIKDPKIRKAVRAWAEAIEADEVVISYSRHDYLKITDVNADCDICFDYEIGYTYNETTYSIAELCGEEE